jgi:hypothetical protein
VVGVSVGENTVVGFLVVGAALGSPSVTVGRSVVGLLVVGEVVLVEPLVGLIVLGISVICDLEVGLSVVGDAAGGLSVVGEVLGLRVSGLSTPGVTVGKDVMGEGDSSGVGAGICFGDGCGV